MLAAGASGTARDPQRSGERQQFSTLSPPLSLSVLCRSAAAADVCSILNVDLRRVSKVFCCLRSDLFYTVCLYTERKSYQIGFTFRKLYLVKRGNYLTIFRMLKSKSTRLWSHMYPNPSEIELQSSIKYQNICNEVRSELTIFLSAVFLFFLWANVKFECEWVRSLIVRLLQFLRLTRRMQLVRLPDVWGPSECETPPWSANTPHSPSHMVGTPLTPHTPYSSYSPSKTHALFSSILGGFNNRQKKEAAKDEDSDIFRLWNT